MKQSLQLKLGQSLTMTPQLQQAIRLLQLSTLDLQNEIQEALDSNPMLEIVEEASESENNAANDSDNSYDNPTHTESLNGNESNQESSNDHEASVSQNEASAGSSSDDEPSAEDNWSSEIPNDLPVDTSWDDVYQSNVPSGPALGDDDEQSFESPRSNRESLQDHLLWQLNLTPFSDQDYLIALTIIDAIEPSGLLTSSVGEIYEGLVM